MTRATLLALLAGAALAVGLAGMAQAESHGEAGRALAGGGQ